MRLANVKDEMKKLALRAQVLDWNMAKLNREVNNMALLFPEPSEDDRQRYLFHSTLGHVPGGGYKPFHSETIKGWLTNIILIGWWQPNEKEPDVIVDNHPAVLDRALFEEGYAALTGYTLEGEPVLSPRVGVTRIRKSRETPYDAIFHGKLTAVSPDQNVTVIIHDSAGKLHYRGKIYLPDNMFTAGLFSIPVTYFDAIIVNRLRTLILSDKTVKDRVKTSLEQVYTRQQEDFASIVAQLGGISVQLTENAKKRIKTNKDGPMYDKLADEASTLLEHQKSLEAKKDKLGIVDSPEEIKKVHDLLGNFDEKYPKYLIEDKQRLFSLLISCIEIEVVSSHWLRLSIDWLDALCPRIDIAFLWRNVPAYGSEFSGQEDEIIKCHYPHATRLEILKLLPDRTWVTIQEHANALGIKREIYLQDKIFRYACYTDLKVGGRWLFGDYETTVNIIREVKNEVGDNLLYPVWLLSANLEHCNLIQSVR